MDCLLQRMVRGKVRDAPRDGGIEGMNFICLIFGHKWRDTNITPIVESYLHQILKVKSECSRCKKQREYTEESLGPSWVVIE